jgi:hypothetical protein
MSHRIPSEPHDTLAPSGESRDDMIGGGPPPAATGHPEPEVRPDRPGTIGLDAEGVATEPTGTDTIADGRAPGATGPAHATRGQGQGG